MTLLLLSLRGTPLFSVIARSKATWQSQRGGSPSLSTRTTCTAQGIITIAMPKQHYVYIMTNKSNTVLYTGVTSNLQRRAYEHREKLADGFTKNYSIVKLLYYEVFDDIENAILREKQIKAGSRRKKIELVNTMNRQWHDLYDEL